MHEKKKRIGLMFNVHTTIHTRGSEINDLNQIQFSTYCIKNIFVINVYTTTRVASVFDDGCIRNEMKKL